MFAVSVISTIKVERPVWSSSPAPMRAKIRSQSPMTARFAGTKLPASAISAMSAFWRMNVDFPAMLGPVTSASVAVAFAFALAPTLPSVQSFGTNFPPSERSRTGCLACSISRMG